MAIINLNENNFNKSFNSKLSSDEFNSYLNDANLVTNNLVDLLKDYYGNMEISVSCTDEEIQTFLEGSISNFIIKSLSNLYLNYIDTEISQSIYSTQLRFKYRYLNYIKNDDGTYSIKSETLSKNLLYSEEDNSDYNLYYKRYTTSGNIKLNVLQHKNKISDGNYGLTGNFSGWGISFKVPRILSSDEQGHINSISDHNITIPNPSNLDLIYQAGINENVQICLLASYSLDTYKELEILINPITDVNYYINEIIDISLLKDTTKRLINLNEKSSNQRYDKGLLLTYDNSNGIYIKNTFTTSVFVTIYGRKG